MIERYTLKFTPAVSSKELQRIVAEPTSDEELRKVHFMKGRIEFIGEIEDIKKLTELLRELSKR
jgi:hypothetical protein